MSKEFFTTPRGYDFDDFSAHSVIEYIEFAGRKSAWTEKKLRRVCDQTNKLLDKSDEAGDNLDVFAMVGDSVVYTECEDDLSPFVYGDENAILWGQVTDFEVKMVGDDLRDERPSLCVRIEAYDETPPCGYWVPVAWKHEIGLALEIVDAAEPTVIRSPQDTPVAERGSATDEERMSEYRHLAAEDILGDDAVISSFIAEAVTDMYESGTIVNLDEFSTAVNMTLSEEHRDDNEFYVTFSGDIDRMELDGSVFRRCVDEKEYVVVGMDFVEDPSAPGGLRPYVYMSDERIDRIYRADMRENNFDIERVTVSDETEDVSHPPE